ncbi:hypothetical protein AB1Y20_011834 [Prymnesium parvum]|uniref:1-phosphatidylinositol 4-kinase n=1 Tax=Prymnesium parvum TaxID=97485 RepID=A0AB34IHM6_PRYPA
MRMVALLCAFLPLSGAILSNSGGQPGRYELWERLWRRDPREFEDAMDRLVLDRPPRWRRAAARPPLAWRGRGDALRLLLQVWRQRDDPASLLAACDTLSSLLLHPAALDELELYLPQLAHLVLCLPADSLLASLLERFVLRVCESNVHWALQLRWIAYASLHENRPELGGDARSDAAHARAARLLQLVEQSVVYGSKMVNRDKLRAAALTHNVQLWRRSFMMRIQEAIRDGTSADAALSAPLPSADAAALLTPAAREVPSVLMEGPLLKRRRRDSFGVWRCLGESWAPRHFSLRGAVLYYYRSAAHTRARGAMPVGQCTITMRPSPYGDYIKLSARFSHRTMRIRGATAEETARWLHALRQAAGLPPLYAAAAGWPSPPRLPSAAAREAGAAAPRREAEGAPLSMSQRCSWLYLTAQLDFVRSLAQLSEAVYTPVGTQNARRPEPATARRQLRALLDTFSLPPLAYVPLCRSSSLFRPILRIPSSEATVIVTRARASALLCAEVYRPRHGRTLSRVFESVRKEHAGAVFEGLAERPRSGLLDTAANPYADDIEDDDYLEDYTRLRLAMAREHTPKPKPPPPPPPRVVERPSLAASSEGSEDVLDAIYGEPWAAKVERVRQSSPFGRRAGWELLPFISKANDDVRQEVFIMQLISFLEGVFPAPLHLRPYQILSTGPNSGLIEMVVDTKSLDAIKKSHDFPGLRAHFEAAYGPDGSPRFLAAQHNFLRSLAAYSVVSYLLMIKDRHNGNILLDRDGFLIHIDFGFVLGRAPGGVASLEAAVPFKLTREFVDVLGGPTSPLFTHTFPRLCTAAFRAARAHADTLLSLIEMTSLASGLPCFAAASSSPAAAVRERLALDVPDARLAEHVGRLVALSYANSMTWAYDRFQYLSNGIAE